MKIRAILLGGILALASITVHAQDVNNTSLSQSASQSQTDAKVTNSQVFEAADHMSSKIKSNQGIILGGFSSSFAPDYCGGTVQGGIGVLGFTAAGGAPKFDVVCQELRSIERNGQIIGQTMSMASAELQMAHPQTAGLYMIEARKISKANTCIAASISRRNWEQFKAQGIDCPMSSEGFLIK